MQKKILLSFGTLVFALTILFAGGFVVTAEESVNEEETEEEVEEAIERLEENQTRVGRMKEVISLLLKEVGEDAPQREALEGVLERAEEIGERVRQRMQEAQERLIQAMERRRLAQQNKRMETMKETIEGLIDITGDDEDKSEARSALEAVRERAQGIQDRIKERIGN